MGNQHSYIKNIYLENFLCHEKSSIALGPSYNLLVGPNGSGKSAVLNALDFLTGNNPKRYNRRKKDDRDAKEAKNLRKGWGKFVKYGEENSLVRVTICTQERDVTISKEIRITKKNENRFFYKINGKKATQSKVTRKFGELGVNIGNPFNVIHQTYITDLVNNLTPETITQVIANVSGINEMKESSLEVYQRVVKVNDDIYNLNRKQKEIDWRINKLTSEVERLHKLKEIKEKLNQLKHQENWIIRKEIKETVENLEKAKNHIDNEIKNINLSLEAIQDERSRIQKAIQSNEIQNDEARDKISFLKTDTDSYSSEIQNMKSSIIQKISISPLRINRESLVAQLENLNETVDNLQIEVQTINTKIAELGIDQALVDDYNASSETISDSQTIIDNYIKNISTEALFA
ncbi:MAG: AAA family ATPase, partial [Candidatus Odinarchaeota archaeon]